MALSKESELTSVLVSIKKSQNDMLKKQGINRSRFVRQAIDSFEMGKWNYTHVDEE